MLRARFDPTRDKEFRAVEEGIEPGKYGRQGEGDRANGCQLLRACAQTHCLEGGSDSDEVLLTHKTRPHRANAR